MKKFRRLLSIVLSVIITVGTVSTGIEGFDTLFTAKASGAYAETLKENSDGSFRILQLSDIQDNSYLSAKAFATIRLAVRRYNPNLIVLTGDNVLNCAGDHVFHTTIDSLVDEFRDASGNQIPFAVTFGNHDYEVNYRDEERTQKISLREQYEYYLSKGAVNLTQTGLDTSAVSPSASDNSATLWGTGYVDVYTHDGAKVARRVILLNTGSYDSNNRDYFARVGYNVETQREESYANVVSAVNTWTNAVNTAGEKIRCIVYQHIALQEVYLGDSPACSILTRPTVPGSITHACYKYINNFDVRGTDPATDPGLSSRKQYVVSTVNPTLNGTFDEAPKSSYSSTKELFKALAKENVIGLFYGHDHGNTVSAETVITYDGVQYTLTQGFGGGIDVYDGNYDGIDPQGSCYVIDRDGDLIKEPFSYTGLLTDNVTYPSGDDRIKYIKEVALFNGSSFESACSAAVAAGFIPVTRAFPEGNICADLNSNERGNRYFSGNGNQYECIAYRQTSDPDEALTDLRIYVTDDAAYSRSNQLKNYTLNGMDSVYRIVSGCDGNVNFGITSGAPSAFLYYTKNRNAGSPLTELFVEIERSYSTNAYRTIDHRCLQTGNFVETFGTNGISSFSKVRIANLNPGANRDKVTGDSVYLFLKRYDGCSGYNVNYSCEVAADVSSAPDAAAQALIDNLGGYIYGVCQPNGNYELLSDAGFNWVRFDIPCPFDKNGYNNGNIKYVRNEYNAFKAKCQAYKAAGFKILAVTPYPKDLISDMSIAIDTESTESMDAFMDIAADVAKYIYNDIKNDGNGNHRVDALQITNEMGLVTFTAPLNIEQAATYIGVQLETINTEKLLNNDTLPIGYNSADLLQTSKDLLGYLQPYNQYCNFTAIDLYTGNQGDASPADYVEKVVRFHNMTQKPVIITEFGFWSEGGLKTAEQKAAILLDNYGYHSEAEAIADGQNFINKLPSQFRKTLNQDYPGRENEWPGLVFSKYSNHFYGETSPYTINDIPHTPEGQAEYFREVMTELKKVNCLAGMIIYCCQDHEVCFNCGHSWCPYETKFGLCNYDGTPKPALYAVKELIAGFSAADAEASGDAASSVSDAGELKTTVNVYHKNGDKALSCSTGEIYKGGTVITAAKHVPGYTCSESPAEYQDVSSAVSKVYSSYTPVTYTASKSSDGVTSEVSFNIDGTDLVLDTPQKTGYVFAGWKAVSVDGTGLSRTNFIMNKVYAAGTYRGMYGNVTFESQWEKIPYTVTFDVSNGGTGLSTANKTVHNGEPYGELATVVPPSGYYFTGWNTRRDGSGTVVRADTVCNLTSDQTLYACYTDTAYHVAYDNLFIPELWVSKGGNNPSKPDEQGAVYNSGTNSISLTYANPGGVSGSEVTTSTNPNSMTIPVTAGTTYSFSVEVKVTNATQGWANFQLFVFDNTGYTALCDSGAYVNNNSSSVITGTYTAPSGATKATIRFSNKTTGATITYKDVRFVEKSVADRLGNSISYPRSYDTVAAGHTYTDLPVPVRSGYVFDGWYSDTGLTDKIDENDTAVRDVTLYSKWTVLNEITYDNLFSISEYAASKSVILKNHPGNATVDVGNGSITVPGGSTTPYTSEESSSGYYTINVAANTRYYLTFTKENGDGRIFVFFRDVLAANVETGGVNTVQNIEKSGTGYWIGTGFFYPAGTYTFWFSSPTATKITIRFDANGANTRTYRNVTLIDEAHYYPDSTYATRFSFVSPGAAYGELQTPSRQSYRFDGWYDNASCTGSPISPADVAGNGNVKLFSKWTEAYDVMYNSIFDFDLWGQKAKKSWSNATATIDYGANSYTITANSNSSSEATSEGTGGGTNGSNVYAMPVIPGHSYRVSADIAAAASNNGVKQYNVFVFEYDTLQRIQNYERIGDSSRTFTLSPGESGTYTVDFTAEADARYIALRLALKSSGASTGTFSNIRIQDMTATPCPEASVRTNVLPADSLISLPDREGFDVNGWYDTVGADGTVGGTRCTDLSSLTGNKTLYAKYTPKTYTVTYISSVGITQTFRSVAYGENPAAAYTPAAAIGYRFVDWYSDEELLTFAPSAVTGPLTLYAKWEPITCSVGYDNIFLIKSQNVENYENRSGSTLIESRTFDKNSGTVTMIYQNPGNSSERNLTSDFINLPEAAGNNTYYIVSADVSATDCEARIMTFFYDESGNPCSIRHTNDASHPVTENDGTPNYVETPIYSAGSSSRHYYVVKIPEGCKKIKLRFDCLNTDTSKKRTAVFSSIRVVEKTSNTYATAAAVYSKLEGTVAYASPYSLPSVTNPGYSFCGWYKDAACTVPASSSVCSTLSDHTVYSKWEINSYRITFDPSGGTCPVTGKNVVFNSTYGELPVPAPRTGFVFKGWYDSTAGGNQITSESRLTDEGNKTLYAQWEHDSFIENITADISVENKLLFGTDTVNMNAADLAGQFENTNVSVDMKAGRMATGTTVNLTDDTGTVYDTITVVIFGDVNGDGWYDGTDATIVSAIAGGMLTREQAGEAVWAAADCNHDGVIDSLDVVVLEQAGVLLAGIDQNRSNAELQSDTAYLEYVSLIDQSPSVNTENGSPAENTGEQQTPDSPFKSIVKLLSDLLSIIKKMTAYFSSIFPGIAFANR